MQLREYLLSCGNSKRVYVFEGNDLQFYGEAFDLYLMLSYIWLNAEIVNIITVRDGLEEIKIKRDRS